ncbi:MAG: single-stranded DNA-binding protein [Oscillospiraceae bacterium]|nr:single-stranded DNA-binding protein [Lachnospiraceae bacterium]MBR6923872.1 single-stranded DNA-binding protein [Oscillospiraceae bacterium]
MNRWIGVGRLTRNPEVTWTQGDEPFAIAKFSLAIDRIARKDGSKQADFIPCVAYRQRAEFAGKHFAQGDKVVVEGHITSGSYKNKAGETVYTLEVTVDTMDFAGKKTQASAAPEADAEGFMVADSEAAPF